MVKTRLFGSCRLNFSGFWLFMFLTVACPILVHSQAVIHSEVNLSVLSPKMGEYSVLMIGEHHPLSTAREVSLDITMQLLKQEKSVVFASEFFDQNDGIETELNSVVRMPTRSEFNGLLRRFYKNHSFTLPSDFSLFLLRLLELKVAYQTKLKICALEDQLPYGSDGIFLAAETENQKKIAARRYNLLSTALKDSITLEEFYKNVRDPMWANHLNNCVNKADTIVIHAGGAHASKDVHEDAKYFPYYWHLLHPGSWLKSIFVAALDPTLGSDSFTDIFKKPSENLPNFIEMKQLMKMGSPVEAQVGKFDFIYYRQEEYSDKLIYSSRPRCLSCGVDKRGDPQLYPIISYINGDKWDKIPVKSKNCMGHLSIGSGSGFYLGQVQGKHYLGTALHVVSSPEGIETNIPVGCGNFNFGRIKSVIYSSESLDFAIAEIETEVTEEMPSFKIERNLIPSGSRLTSFGYGFYLNDREELTVDDSSDCILLDNLENLQLRTDPDPVSPSPYRTFMSATGCDVSHGDSGGLLLARESGHPIGFLTTTHVIKTPASSQELKTMAGKNKEIWSAGIGSMMVPLFKVHDELRKEIRDGHVPEFFNFFLN